MSTYLMHYGIKGMKWGVRRYQNDDGTLTEAGKARYGGQREYKDSGFRRALTGETVAARLRAPNGQTALITQSINNKIANRYTNRSNKYAFKAEKAKNKGNTNRAEKMSAKQEKLANRAEAYRKLDLDRLAYDHHTSTGKIFMQNLVTGNWALGEIYRNNRAMGMSRGQSFVNTMLTGGIGQSKRVEEHYRNAD